MGSITAADFISLLDDELSKNKITATQHSVLINGMSELLDMLNDNPDINDNLTIVSRDNNKSLTVNTSRYRRHYDKNKILSEEWFSGGSGFYQRDGDRPITNFYYSNGDLEKALWRKDGMMHRDGDKPAIVEYYVGDKIKTQKWAVEGDIHRDGDKPAELTYFENGRVSREEWKHKGNLHRDGDKPAFISYHSNGQAAAERWFVNDVLCREDHKPSTIYYNEQGQQIGRKDQK